MTVSWRRSASGEAGRDLTGVGRGAGRVGFLAAVAPWRLVRLAGAGCPSACSAVPHAPQNLNGGGFSAPQLGHRWVNGLPHAPQNFIPAGFSKLQLGHCMVPLYSFGLPGARKTPALLPSG